MRGGGEGDVFEMGLTTFFFAVTTIRHVADTLRCMSVPADYRGWVRGNACALQDPLPSGFGGPTGTLFS